MNLAQGAIDGARAAGADRYAAADLAAAVDALKRSEEAVTQNDYRLALSLAIESRERAQIAAKAAGENRAKARGDAERTIAEVNVLLNQARERMRAPDVARLPRRTVAATRAVIDTAQKNMQEARAAVTGDDYERAVRLTEGMAAQIQAALAALKTPDGAEPARKRR